MTLQGSPLTVEELRKMDAYWRASVYLSLGMIFLRDNPLLVEPLKVEHTKIRLLGHWGSDPNGTKLGKVRDGCCCNPQLRRDGVM
jgi:phosphoketolase